jgi:hypothetical protein
MFPYGLRFPKYRHWSNPPGLDQVSEFTQLQFLSTNSMLFPEICAIDILEENKEKESQIECLTREKQELVDQLCITRKELVEAKDSIYVLESKLKLALERIEEHADEFIVVIDNSQSIMV